MCLSESMHTSMLNRPTFMVLPCYSAFPIKIGKDRSIFIGNLRLFWIHFYRLMGNAQYASPIIQ
jgi:hypothetical protein